MSVLAGTHLHFVISGFRVVLQNSLYALGWHLLIKHLDLHAWLHAARAHSTPSPPTRLQQAVEQQRRESNGRHHVLSQNRHA